MKKSEKIQLTAIFSYLVVLTVCLVLLIVLKSETAKYIVIGVLFVTAFLGYLGIRLLRNHYCRYRCPQCQETFRISFGKSLSAKYHPGDWKELTCPQCQTTAQMKEESID